MRSGSGSGSGLNPHKSLDPGTRRLEDVLTSQQRYIAPRSRMHATEFNSYHLKSAKQGTTSILSLHIYIYICVCVYVYVYI